MSGSMACLARLAGYRCARPTPSIYSHSACTARPVHTDGSKAPFSRSADHFRSSSVSRPFQSPSTCLKGAKSGLMRANSIAYGGDEELDMPREDRSTLPIENQSFVSSGEGVFIPAFSFPGFDSIPGVLLAKHRPKFPTALRGLLAKPLLRQDR